MNKTRGYIILWILVAFLVLGGALDFAGFTSGGMFLILSLLASLIVLALHIRIAIALWVETVLREEKNQSCYLGLGSWFWALSGLFFGLLGLAVFRFVNPDIKSNP